MIEGLEHALADYRQPALPELQEALAESLGERERPARLSGLERIKSHTFRVRVEIGDDVRSLVIKRMLPPIARRNELVIRRWLPESGLPGITPALQGIGAQRSGRWVWHVYEDLGPWMLDPREPDRERVAAAVRTIAGIHTRFESHPMLAECRLDGQDLGIAFYSSSVRDAISNLESLRSRRPTPASTEAQLCDRLLSRLRRLLDELPARARALARWGGPDTLLHGDLWTPNIFAEPADAGPRVRLIDWDRSGVGPASYDLSVFLQRFAPEHRSWILDLYRRSMDGGGWRIPDTRALNEVFETAEYARYANCAIWPAVALGKEVGGWELEALAEVDRWFEAFHAVLPEPSARTVEPNAIPDRQRRFAERAPGASPAGTRCVHPPSDRR